MYETYTTTTNDIMKYKYQFENNIKKILEILNNISNDSYNDIVHNEIKETLSNITNIVLKGIKQIEKTLSFFTENAEWDKFNVAFFGETNAGKSTLIEALIKGDGGSIGEGSKDFTKTLINHQFNNSNLIDMPGIEGDERKVITHIKKAIEKAHVIFYVLGPQELEEGTLRKIKYYLKDRTKVISVINVRGRPGNYRLREKKLENGDIGAIVNDTEKKFKKEIGNNYYKNILVNAYIGFLSVGNPKRENLVKDKNKLLEVFGSFEKARLFSNIQEIENLIKELHKTSKIDIAISNTYKGLKNIEEILGKILKEKKQYDKVIKEIGDQMHSAFKDIQSIGQKYTDNMTIKIENMIDEMKNEMKKKIFSDIDNGNQNIEDNINHIKKEYEQKFNDELKNMFLEMEKEIKQREIIFINRLSKLSDFFKFDSAINFEEITETMKIGFNYIVQEFFSVATSILTIIGLSVIDPILLVIAGIIFAIKKIWDWFFVDPEKRKNEAKKKANHEIEVEINKVKRRMLIEFKKEMFKVDNNIKKISKNLNLYLKKLYFIENIISKKITMIKNIQADISKELIEFVLGKNITLAYINLQLSKILVVGECNKLDNQLFRVDQILQYRSIPELFNDIKAIIDRQDNILYLNAMTDEFIYRALSSNTKTLNLIAVRKQKEV